MYVRTNNYIDHIYLNAHNSEIRSKLYDTSTTESWLIKSIYCFLRELIYLTAGAESDHPRFFLNIIRMSGQIIISIKFTFMLT